MLSEVLKDLNSKRFIRNEECEVLERLSSKISGELFNRQVQKHSEKLKTTQKYSPQLRTFALTLHYYLPAAYCYVRDCFDTCLPHPKTLYKWYRSVKASWFLRRII